MMPDSGSFSPLSNMARRRCSKCQQVRYCTPRWWCKLIALIGLAVFKIRNIAMYQSRNGRCVPSIAVPTVTVKVRLQGKAKT